MNAAIVIDTNYLIHSLEYVKELHLLLPAEVILFLPLMVIQELDGLKSKHLEARKAIDYIHQSMDQKIRIQRMDEIVRPLIENDDRILDSCLYVMQKLTPSVFFLCNDKNLCIKAKAHSIPTISYCSLPPKELLHSILAQSSAVFQSLHNSSLLENYTMLVQPDKDTEMIFSDHEEVEFSEILCEISYILIGCLSASLTRVFERRIGAEWQRTILYPPPWDLGTIFHLLSKDVAFKDLPVEVGQINFSSMEQLAKDMDRSVRQKKAMLTKGDVDTFLQNVENVLYICDFAGLPHDRLKASNLLKEIKFKCKYI
jgi:rRNA-processing protein FCF1